MIWIDESKGSNIERVFKSFKSEGRLLEEWIAVVGISLSNWWLRYHIIMDGYLFAATWSTLNSTPFPLLCFTSIDKAQ